mgnify:CR=1 FL=1
MLKKVIGTKGIFLLASLITALSLSGCADGLTEQESEGTVIYKEKLPENQETEHSEYAGADNTSNNAETVAPAKEDTADTVKPEAKAPVQSEPVSQPQAETSQPQAEKSQPQAETSVTLTDNGKAFLAQMCNELNDFNSRQAMDDKFWHDFLFNSYTGGTSENIVTEQVYREDLGFDETVVKVSIQEAQEHVKLVFGIELPDFKPAFEDMEKGQTSFFYKDGNYYIGVSDMPDYQYTFSECVADKENASNTIVKYTIDFMGESNVGTVTLGISPENNENGFIIRSKVTEFVK